MKNARVGHKYMMVKDSMEKIGKIFKREFPYSEIIFDHKKVNGHYYVHLDRIKPDDVDKFIEVSFDSSKLHGIGVDIPILMRYKKIEENII
jgi:hypothetical protein